MDLESTVQKIYQFLFGAYICIYFPCSQVPRKNETSKISVRDS